MIERKSLNLLVDLSAFALGLWLISTGLLIHFVLPPRSGPLEVLSLTRHDWGELHLYIALGFIALVLFHLFLHAQWIRAMLFRSTPTVAGRYRPLLGIVLVALLFAGALWPLALPVRDPGRGDVNAQHRADSEPNVGGARIQAGWGRR